MDTLVLNASYLPINQVSWDRAVSLAYCGLVETLEVYDDWTVKSPSQVWQVPAVIRFLKGVSGRKKGIRFSRENIYARDKGRCGYCGIHVPRSEVTYDHILPKAQNGKTEWLNILSSCLSCNQKKGNRTPAQAGMRPLFKPVKPASLPGEPLRLKLPKGIIPSQWDDYLRSTAYWTVTLRGDE